MRSAAVTEGRRIEEDDPELRRLREDLYRPSPPPDAVARYTALRERVAAPVAAEPVEAPAASDGPRRRRRLPLVLAGVVAAVALVGGAAVALIPPPARDPGAAEVLVTGGPYAVSDRDAIDSLLRVGATDTRRLVRAVQGSELPQLAVWDVREPGVWLQQGRGDLRRRFAAERPAPTTSWPFSVIVQCSGSGRYRWAISGTTADRPEVHVIETASAACGPSPTVATFTRPAGAVVRGFDLTVGSGTRWGMAFVYAVDRS